MLRALVIATVAVLAMARPETYREKEDFQYSRSSTDEGSKSGYYGAQRGNMGGNYERAHNMDTLAQHQMGGLVRTVQGEVGDGAKEKSGSVFSSANSRGIYGSGHYDLSNVQGRNFQEGVTLGNSQSSLSSQQAASESQSQSYSTAANNAYGSQSQNSRYRGYGYNTGSDQALYSNNNMQSADNLQSASQYDATQSGRSSGYNSQSGYQGQSVYDQAALQSSSAYGTSDTRGSHYRLVSASPVRVYIRPGSTVTLPVAAQTYDASQGSSSIYDRNSQRSSTSQRGSTFNQNSINSEAEVLGTDQQSAYRPKNNAKQYESSYSYRKEWEKNNAVTNAPFIVTTANPLNSEFSEDTQAQGSEQREASAQATRNVQRYNTKSASSRRQTAYNTRAQEQSSSSELSAASSLANSNANTAYNYGASANLNSANLNSQVEDIGAKPKSYQSSYSYHKSWERQGDPYVIKPSTNGLYTAADSQASQRLTSSNQASSSQRHGSHDYQGQQGYSNGADCDENGHIRVARSVNLARDRSSYQQSQNMHEGQEYVGQQSQNLEDFGQQSQNLNDFSQQSQNLQDFGQQSQNLNDFGQQSQNLEDLSQKSQYDGQDTQKFEDIGQQSQNVQDLGQQSQRLEDFGQQTQDEGQQTQNFDRIEDLGQQSQNQWDQLSQTNAGQQTQNIWSMLETIQHKQGGSNTEQRWNGMEHTRFNQESQGSVFESHAGQRHNSNAFAHTIFEQHRSDLEKTDLGKANEKELPQYIVSIHPGQQTQFYYERPLSADMNQNVYAPISSLDSDRVRQETLDWQKYPEAPRQNSDTGYSHQHHSYYQSVYGANAGTYQTSHGYNPNTQNTENFSTNLRNSSWVFPTPLSHNTQTYTSRTNNSTSSTSNTNISQESGSTSLSSLWDMIDDIEKQTISRKETDNSYQDTQGVQNNTNSDLTQNFNENSFNNKDKVLSTSSTSSISNTNISPESGSTSLSSLWDMIDDIEKQTISRKETDNSYQDTQDVQNNNSDLTQNFNENSFNNKDEVHYAITPLPSMTEPNIKTSTTKQDNLRPHYVERGDIEPEKEKPQEEEGRGDIGPQDNSNAPSRNLEILGISSAKPTVNKTPEELDTSTLTKVVSELGVLSLVNQKKLEHRSEKNDWKPQNGIAQNTSSTPSSYHYEHPNSQQTNNTDQQSYNHIENVDQQNVNTDKKNTDLQIQDFSHQEENFRQEHNMEHQFASFDQQNINVDQPNINHHNMSGIEHSPVEVQQQHTVKELATLGQQTEDISQQSFNQFDDLGQQTENVGHEHQKSDNFGQQSEGLQPESLGNFNQQSESLGQEHQKFDNFGQQSQGFQPESLGNFNQQSESLGQEHQKFDNFGQQSQGFQPESLGNFNQQSESLGQEPQKFDNFGQQSEGFQQESLGDFLQQEQLQQESLSNFDNQSENIDNPQKEQQLEKWGQENVNLEQQSQSEDLWKPNSEQQNSQVEIFDPTLDNKEGRAPSQGEPVVEPEFVTQKTNVVDTPPEPVTEKVGFWNKVGSKFGSAKDKVKSWFTRS